MWLGDAGTGPCKHEALEGTGREEEFKWLMRGMARADIAKPAIVVCHTLPPAWTWPYRFECE